MSHDPSVRRILPQDSQSSQNPGMGSFTFAPQQFPQRETQKNYVFVDEHNRHKRLKVMRACEGCRRRKIKCDAATTNTWPCSACIRLKLHCVKPNGFDGSADSTTYEAFMNPSDQFQMHMSQGGMDHRDMYAGGGYADGNSAPFQSIPYEAGQAHHNMHYTTVPPPSNVLEHQFASQNAFPTPPLQQSSQPGSSPDAQSVDSYQQQDLADLLGTLKMNEVGTAPYLRNKASFRREDTPLIDDDEDFEVPLPPITHGSKVRIPPELMPDEADAIHYFDLYFTHVHPLVPVLNRSLFYRQWATARETISPLILESLFAIGGRLAEDPGEGQQWLALASRHADAFMDVPRLSTLQAQLIMLKARESAPKRGYYYRSWMSVVHCVQLAKDLGLDEHYEDHQAGMSCEQSPEECQLRTRIWQTLYVTEFMVGAPQGRHDLSIKSESVDFSVPRPIAGGDDAEYHASRNFTYFARLVKNIRGATILYVRLKRQKDWGIDPEFQQLSQSFVAWKSELPGDLGVTFPADGSPPWLPSAYMGNMHSYHYLTLILYHRPVLSFLDPTTNEEQWKHHMMICYNAAKNLCRLQEAIMDNFGLTGLQSMLRGFSFTVYAGLSCIVLHLVAIVSPDPELNSDAREFFTRHMRIMEKVMEVWAMPELQKQIDAVREAFSADVRKPFLLKPSFPYGSPVSSTHPSPPRGYQPNMDRLSHLNTQTVSYISHPISPPISTGPLDSKSDSPSVQSLAMMPHGGQATDLPQNMSMAGQPVWNPARIFEQWNTSFGQAGQAESSPGTAAPLSVSSSGAPDVPTLQDIQAVNSALQSAQHDLPPQQFSSASVPHFVTPAMWQESVASVYEGGLKRAWDFDGLPGR